MRGQGCAGGVFADAGLWHDRLVQEREKKRTGKKIVGEVLEKATHAFTARWALTGR
jgi:hypothetical protein